MSSDQPVDWLIISKTKKKRHHFHQHRSLPNDTLPLDCAWNLYCYWLADGAPFLIGWILFTLPCAFYYFFFLGRTQSALNRGWRPWHDMGSFHSSHHISHLVFFEGKLALAFPSLLPCLLGLSSIIIFFCLLTWVRPSHPTPPSFNQLGVPFSSPSLTLVSPLHSVIDDLFICFEQHQLFICLVSFSTKCVCVCVCTSHIFPSPLPSHFPSLPPFVSLFASLLFFAFSLLGWPDYLEQR